MKLNKLSFKLVAKSKCFLFQKKCNSLILIETGYSQLVVSLGIMSILLMLIGSSMAASAQTSTGHASRPQPSMSVIKKWIFASLIQLEGAVARTQADFVS